MNILIFEDEIYNFSLLRHQLMAINSDYNVIGPISTVEEGMAFLSYHNDIDLIIADIQLNDGLSFDALRHAPEDTPIIFTTAYDEYALRAFEYNSLSYLLKPVGEEELANAVVKALRHAHAADAGADGGNVYAGLAADPAHRHCFLVRTSKGERRMHVAMMRYVASEDKAVYVHLLDGTSYPIDMTIAEVAAQLDPHRFMRVSRKYILPLEQVKGSERLPNGRMRLMLYGTCQPEIIVSRDMRKRVRAWMEGSTDLHNGS